MKAYPLELRQRIVDAVDNHLGTYAEIAEMFSVHERYIYRLLNLRRTTGSIAVRPHGGGAPAKLQDKHVEVLTTLVADHPDHTLAELRDALKKQTRTSVSVSTVWRALSAVHVTVKKKTRIAAEADPEERAAFQAEQPLLPTPRLRFLDEFSINLAMTRPHARAVRGTRAVVTESFEKGVTVSVIATLGLDGMCAPMTLEGAFDGAAYALYVEHFLVPELRQGDVVIMDQVPFHKNERAISLIEAAGAEVLPLPAYSPDMNPIEQCISKLKAALRSAKARTVRRLHNALARAMRQITEADIRGWFTHCGYTCPAN
jgi:transposase